MKFFDLPHIKTSKAPAEYTIYAYDKYCKDMVGHNKWQCLSSGDDASKVLSEAKMFFESDKFQKIEVKKKFFNKKKNCYSVSIFRVFDEHSKADIFTAITTTMLAVLFGGLMVLETL